MTLRELYGSNLEECRVAVVGTNHIDHGSGGKYFAFDNSAMDCILGSNWASGLVQTVRYSQNNEDRNVILWKSQKVTPCDSQDCGHGRIEPVDDWADGDWEIGQYFILPGYTCGADGCLQTPNPSKDPTAVPTASPTEELPIPGEVYTINTPNVTGNFTLNENTIYVNPTQTVECNFEIGIFYGKKQLLDTSYITVTKDIYDASSAQYSANSFLLMTEEVLQSASLPSNCRKHPALKITSVEINDQTVKLFVQIAEFYEYIDEMDIEATHIPLMDDGEEAPIFPPNADDIKNQNPNITNITVLIEEAVCVEEDENGNEIAEIQPDDGGCGNVTVEDEFGGEYTQFGFNEPSQRRRNRRLLGKRRKKWKKRLKKLAKKAVQVVEFAANTAGLSEYVEYVKTIISILTGNVHERFENGIGISNTMLYEVSGSQEIETKKSKSDSPNPLTVTVDGDFSIDTGVEFVFRAYVDFVAKYKIFTSKPSFDKFKLVIGADARFATWIYVTLHGGIHIAYEIASVEKDKTFCIGPVPIVLTFYGSITLGLNIDLTLSLSAKFGFEPIYIEYGIEWTKNGGWKQIFDNQLQVIPIYEFGGNVGDSGACFDFRIEPFIQLQFGIVFYKIVDIYVLGTFGLPSDLSWPGSCDATKTACDYSSNQLKFDVGVSMELSIGTVIGVSDIGLTAYEEELSLFSYEMSLFAHCVSLSIPFLDDICCFNGEVIPFPTKSPTPPPTQECRVEVVGTNHIDHGSGGRYFAFDNSAIDCILGSNWVSGLVQTVRYSQNNELRNVVLWKSQKVTPCDSQDCGHGRIEPVGEDGDWEIGQYIIFPGYDCVSDGCLHSGAIAEPYSVVTDTEQSMPYNEISNTFIWIGLITICFLGAVIVVCMDRIISLNKRQYLKYAAIPHHVNDIEDESILEK